MKYFTSELWSKINSESVQERYEAELKWEENDKHYNELFQLIKDRLSKKFLKIYMANHGFHDFRLIKLEVIHGDYGFKSLIKVELFITDERNNWKITYKNVRKIEINYVEEKDSTSNRGFDDWGYDEFLEVDTDTLSHEVLFASGATVLLHFKNRNIFVTKEDRGNLENLR